MYTFSVVIPLFNKAKYILDTLGSVMDQSFKDYEIIIINDGSTDEGLSLIDHIKLPNITIYTQENKGLSAARNKGIELSKGSYIALLDADDLWNVNYLEAVHRLIIKFPRNNVYGTSYCEKRNGKLLQIKTSLDYLKKGDNMLITDFFKSNFQQFIIDQSSLVLERNFAKQNPYNEKLTYNEDVDYFLSYFGNQEIVFINEALMIKNYDVENQLSMGFIADKKIPDLDYFEKIYKANEIISKFISIQRYKYAIAYTLEKKPELKIQILNKINKTHLTYKQKIIIQLPRPIILFLRQLKFLILRLKIRVSSY